MRGWATFDPTERYRLTLHRRWATHRTRARRVCFCLLNPSTADAKVLDPTLTRCLGFAQRWGFTAMEVVNIFALRSTDPAGLRTVDDPVGDGNDAAIVRACNRSELVVVGWGNHGGLLDRSAAVRSLLRARTNTPIRCWARTKAGEPKHPLYLRADAALIDFD